MLEINKNQTTHTTFNEYNIGLFIVQPNNLALQKEIISIKKRLQEMFLAMDDVRKQKQNLKLLINKWEVVCEHNNIDKIKEYIKEAKEHIKEIFSFYATWKIFIEYGAINDNKKDKKQTNKSESINFLETLEQEEKENRAKYIPLLIELLEVCSAAQEDPEIKKLIEEEVKGRILNVILRGYDIPLQWSTTFTCRHMKRVLPEPETMIRKGRNLMW